MPRTHKSVSSMSLCPAIKPPPLYEVFTHRSGCRWSRSLTVGGRSTPYWHTRRSSGPATGSDKLAESYFFQAAAAKTIGLRSARLQPVFVEVRELYFFQGLGLYFFWAEIIFGLFAGLGQAVGGRPGRLRRKDKSHYKILNWAGN